MGRTEFFEREVSPAITTELKKQTAADFEQLAIPLLDSTYNFAYWLTQDRDKAEDLVQETYRKALRGFARFEHGSNFRAWMFRILKNTFLTSCSGADRATSGAWDFEEIFMSQSMQSNSPESVLLRESEATTVRAAIAQLPLQFREVVMLCEIEEASYREAAEILSIPIGTVMSRLSRARNALRTSLSSRIPALAIRGAAAFKPAQG